MSEPALDTASASYATEPSLDVLARFDTGVERRTYRRETKIASVVLTGAAMMMALTASEPMDLGLADWATSGDVSIISGPTEWSAVLASRLSGFRHLPSDWDGEGGYAPPDKAVDEALALIDLLPLGSPTPSPFVAGDGEVGFHWKTGRGFAEVSFYGDGYIYFYAEFGTDGMEIEGTEHYTGRAIPKQLTEALAKI